MSVAYSNNVKAEKTDTNHSWFRYGGYSGTGWGHGVRNIVFRSPDPKVGPETWIRMEDGETHARIIMDSSYN